jgi:CubicO group peptidase (beta-lactamase class C family)
MRKGTTCIVSLLLVLLSGFTKAEEGQQSALTSWIERNLETSDGKIPGASVAVIRNHRIAWAQGFWQSNTELGTAVTPTTLFQACSISKAISALAAVIAFEDHKLGIDENIDNF